MKDKYHAEVLEKLVSFYSKETFYEDDGILHKTCKNAEECWKKLTDNDKNDSKWNYFSLPYIGKNYDGKLVCVGINVNKGGGRNLQEMQIRGIRAFEPYTDKQRHDNDLYGYKYDPGVIESFKTKDKPRIFFEKGMEEAVKRGDLPKPSKGRKPYNGTDLWHRVAVYSKILLDGYYSGAENDFKELAEIYERIIFMDAIKCSPAKNNSKPTNEMKNLCPKHIFFRELEIIQPDNILIMYHWGAEFIRKTYKPVVKGSEDFPGSGKDIDHCQIKIGEKNVNVYYIVHPNCQGRGNRTELFQEFDKVVKQVQYIP